MFIVDAHLDLADSAAHGRAVWRSAREQIPDADGTPTVGLPDLTAGGVGLICATIFCQPAIGGKPGYRTADEAEAMAREQLDWYRRWQTEGRIELVTHRSQLQQNHARDARATIRSILLLEGADAIRSSADVPAWFDAGVRIVGLAWKRTRYAGGTDAPGPLTPEGIELAKALDQAGMIHDASHLAEESFWQLLDLSTGPVIASHSNCRAIVPTDRQLSDDMIRAIARRGGVIGINFFDRFLLPPDQYGQRRATLDDVVRHIRHVCDVVGDARHVGLGTDMDGGFGREHLPIEIETSADLPRLADGLRHAAFADEDIDAIMGSNWHRFFARNLPSRP